MYSSKYVLVSTRMAEQCLRERRSRNDACWANPGHWFLQFYFGAGDDRLWVPARLRDGCPHASKLVLNLRHRRARGAAIALGVAYFTGVLWVILFVAWWLGAVA